jgi:hypothetical protein
MYARRIEAGEVVRCSACGAGHGRSGGAGPAVQAPTAWDAYRPHADEVRSKAFWTAAAVTLLLAPSPAVLTTLVGKPQAGLEHAVTIWHVLWHTLPLTLAVAADAGVLLWLRRHPDHWPKTQKGVTALWCWLGGVLVASMVVGNWLGRVELSDWSRARLGGKAADQQARNTTQFLVGQAVQNKAMIPVAVAVGSAAAVANYFTLYGPCLFISSLVVGTFLGWLWAVKLPDVFAEIDRTVWGGR